MTSKIVEAKAVNPTKRLTFPCLLRSKGIGNVWLAQSPNSGTLLVDGFNGLPGGYAEKMSWDLESFELITEPITIEFLP